MMMLAARTDDLWLPGKARVGLDASTRAEQIARSREELLGLLADLPESEQELSFTDLVERVAPICEEKQTPVSSIDEEAAAKEAAKEIVKSIRRDSKRMRGCNSGISIGGGGLGTRNGGLFLNVYVPPSLTQSLTASRSRRSASSRERETTSECTKRERGSPIRMKCSSHGCWASIWAKRKAKPTKQ